VSQLVIIVTVKIRKRTLLYTCSVYNTCIEHTVKYELETCSPPAQIRYRGAYSDLQTPKWIREECQDGKGGARRKVASLEPPCSLLIYLTR